MRIQDVTCKLLTRLLFRNPFLGSKTKMNLHIKLYSTQNANKDLPKEVRPGLSATQVSLEENTLIYTLKFDNIAFQAFE